VMIFGIGTPSACERSRTLTPDSTETGPVGGGAGGRGSRRWLSWRACRCSREGRAPPWSMTTRRRRPPGPPPPPRGRSGRFGLLPSLAMALTSVKALQLRSDSHLVPQDARERPARRRALEARQAATGVGAPTRRVPAGHEDAVSLVLLGRPLRGDGVEVDLALRVGDGDCVRPMRRSYVGGRLGLDLGHLELGQGWADALRVGLGDVGERLERRLRLGDDRLLVVGVLERELLVRRHAAVLRARQRGVRAALAVGEDRPTAPGEVLRALLAAAEGRFGLCLRELGVALDVDLPAGEARGEAGVH